MHRTQIKEPLPLPPCQPIPKPLPHTPAAPVTSLNPSLKHFQTWRCLADLFLGIQAPVVLMYFLGSSLNYSCCIFKRPLLWLCRGEQAWCQQAGNEIMLLVISPSSFHFSPPSSSHHPSALPPLGLLVRCFRGDEQSLCVQCLYVL